MKLLIYQFTDFTILVAGNTMITSGNYIFTLYCDLYAYYSTYLIKYSSIYHTDTNKMFRNKISSLLTCEM